MGSSLPSEVPRFSRTQEEPLKDLEGRTAFHEPFLPLLDGGGGQRNKFGIQPCRRSAGYKLELAPPGGYDESVSFFRGFKTENAGHITGGYHDAGTSFFRGHLSGPGET